MIELGILNEHTAEKLKLAKQLKDFGYSDEDVSEIIHRAEIETISKEGTKAGE